LKSIENVLKYRFEDMELLTRALTHSSYGFEHKKTHNERLEFLGDAILDFVIADYLFQAYPNAQEGALSKQKSAIVSMITLAKKARELELGRRIRLGVGESKSGGRDKDSILADSLESLIAAIYLDGGIEPARKFIVELFEPELSQTRLTLKSLQDFKTLLQEKLQARGLPLPDYLVQEELGPAHDRSYLVQVRIGDINGPSATGRSKKSAQQACAKLLLDDKDFWQQTSGETT